MPSYDFKCPACGLIFDAFVRDHTTDAVPCIDCKGPAKRSPVAAVNFVFGEGKEVGNTGVDSLDTSLDKAVGRDAQRRWEFVKDRQSQKRRIQRDCAEGNTGDGGATPLKRNPDTGEYAPMRAHEVSRFTRLHKEYDKMFQEHRQERERKGIPKFSED